MKRTITAVALAVLAVPAFAADLPYEQTQFDRNVPSVQERASDASAGSTLNSGVWAQDHSFIAPAQ